MLIIELKTTLERLASPAINVTDGVQQLLHAVTHQAHSVLCSRRAEHRRGVDDLLRRRVEHAKLVGQTQRILKRQTLLTVQQKTRAELGQRRGMKAPVIHRQPERRFPAQIPRQGLHRRLVRDAAAVLEQQNLGQQRRRDRRSPHPLRIALGEVLVAHDPLAMLGQQRKKRPFRQRTNKPRRVKQTYLTISS